jgi:type I restriction enzyme M protein
VLRDDGMSYGDYVEQLTYLLFIKMDDENLRVLAKPSVSHISQHLDPPAPT